MFGFNEVWISVLIAEVAKTWYFTFAGLLVKFACIN